MLNKKGFKKCGLLFLFFTIFGLSLSVSLNTSAIQYSIDSFMSHSFAFPSVDGGFSYSQDHLSITLIDNINNLGINPRNSSFIQSQYDTSTEKCKWYSNQWSYVNPGYSGTQTIDWGGSFIPPWNLDYVLTGNQLCHSMFSYGYTDENISIPQYDTSSAPFVNKLNVVSMLPYNYMYNSITFSNVRTVDGVDYSTNFDISELLQNTSQPGDENYVYYTDKIHSISLPLNFNASLESLDSGDNITFSGRIDFGVGLTSSEVSSLSASLLVQSFTINGGSGFNLPCSLSYYVNGSNNSLSYYCSGNVPSGTSLNSGWYSFVFKIGSTSSSLSVPFTSTPQSMIFSSPFITFFNDPDTYGGSGSIEGNGSFPNVAPGIAHVDSSSADWFSSLKNLFNFNFLNPFSGLFGLFTDQSECVDIPILAGMLNSEETTYCSWFSSDTRNVLTPVLGIASVMLLFGFVVRWLGARSGNFIEDDGGVDFGGLHFQNKYKRR